MNINQIQNVYFIGIGGIGMSALARYFKYLEKNVCGYDKTKTLLTKELQEEGMTITFADEINEEITKYQKENTLIVITPAVPKDHLQWNYFVNHGFEVKKRAEVLGIITKDTFCFAVAGTHGKTTTSSILGHLLFQAGLDVTAFLGGIVEEYNSNVIGNGTTITVVEADEFDRSFLHLHPNIACITSMDADHLDIYGTTEHIEESFKEFAHKVTDTSNLFISKGLPLHGNTVSVTEDATIKASNITIKDGYYFFDIQIDNEYIKDVKFGLPGHHNLSNALMAFAMAKKYGVETALLKKGLESFKGVRRRFSYVIREEKCIYIDDYAHHPTEIEAIHQAVRELYPKENIIAIFQPHLFSRTKDFIDGFATSLSKFDEIILLDIYPAREKPLEGVTSKWLLSKIQNNKKSLLTKDELTEKIKTTSNKIWLTIGAGDIGEMVLQIKNILYDKMELD